MTLTENKLAQNEIILSKRISEFEALDCNETIFQKINNFLLVQKIEWQGDYMIAQISKRKNGYAFEMNEYVQGLIYSLLSGGQTWSAIAPKIYEVDMVFKNYDIDFILNTSPKYFDEELRKIKCGNRRITPQMETLKYNINIFKRLALENGSVDNLFNSSNAVELAQMFGKPNQYKLKEVGYPLAWEFIRNMGIDGAKPDVHMKRILGSRRLGFSLKEMASEDEVIWSIKGLSEKYGIRQTAVDGILWCFCADGYGEMCTFDPKCTSCPIREYCNKNN